MGCKNCSVSEKGTPSGCGNKGHCSSGSCNKMNTFDWLAMDDYYDPNAYPIVEVSFKKGARKDFFHMPDFVSAITGDMVVVEASSGYDVGRISLSGELVRLQMKKKRHQESRVDKKILRRAHNRDLEKLDSARKQEHQALVRARVLARTLGLDMKIGDVEYQGDQRKATFYYTADGRVDFRELVRVFAKEYRVKIEMRQIGSRQESARIGGVGSCGRELCCSTWLSNFKSVNTTAARYQNISINQTKLTGQCGRLKCCLNFELDMYVEALEEYPKDAQKIYGETGKAELLKIDIFKKLMYYSVRNEINRMLVVGFTKEQIVKIKDLNKKGKKDIDLFKIASVREGLNSESDDNVENLDDGAADVILIQDDLQEFSKEADRKQEASRSKKRSYSQKKYYKKKKGKKSDK